VAWFDLDQLKLSGTLCTEIGKSDRSEMGQSGKNSVRVYVFRCAHKLGHCLTELARRVCANNGHSGKPTKRLSLYVTSEQATRSSHSASSAITNEMFAKEPNDARVGRRGVAVGPHSPIGYTFLDDRRASDALCMA